MKKYFKLVLLPLLFMTGCTQQMIRVDSDTYFSNQAAYEDKNTIITANLVDVVDRKDLFEGKTIEIIAPVIHFEERDSPVWYLIFEKEGKNMRAYESDFLGWVPPDAAYLARWAKNEGGDVTARGEVRQGNMELDELTYKTLIVNTSAIPS